MTDKTENKELQAENAQLKEELAKPYDLGVSQLQYDLGNILACIHRDGGHYQIEHGTKKAATDAVAIICEWRNAFDELATEQGKSFTLGQCLDESRKELAAMREQEPVAYANEHFELILDGPDSCAVIKFQRDEKMKYTYPVYAAPVAKDSPEQQEPVAWQLTASNGLRCLVYELRSDLIGWAITPLYVHPDPVAKVPDGLVLVPKEPTEAMRRAADKLGATFSIGDEWTAMINAAQEEGK